MAKNANGNVVIVELKIQLEGVPEISVFGNMKAVFEYFGGALGITYGYLRTIKLKDGPFENSRCRILKAPIWSDKSPEVIERREKEGREELPSAGSYKK